uniref:Vacuolar ATP synthase subunit H n=1 Tax=Trepomonas sp. PC1 TaxID=1076344 RepID=A0A146KBU6_9EUKA|eukprot:JAP93728.1 Vacuolar ATP synthase subunit H [Trepomonas sp. PC1]
MKHQSGHSNHYQMNILKYQYESKQIDLQSCGFKEDVIHQLQLLMTPYALQKQTTEQKHLFVENLITQITFIQKDKQVPFARFLSVTLTELCQVDFRIELLLVTNPRFSELFDFLNKHMNQQDQIQRLIFFFFVSIVSRNLKPDQMKYNQIQQIFVDLFQSLNEQIDSEAMETQYFSIQILNKFLCNEFFMVRLFSSSLTFEVFEAFMDEKNKEFDVKPLAKIIKLFQHASEQFHPPIVYQITLMMWILSFNSQINAHLNQQSITPILIRALSQKNIQQNAKLVNAICQLLNNLQKNEKCLQYIVASGSQRLLQQLTTISWPADSLIEQLLNTILNNIQTQIQQTSTIQKYKIELQNSILEFTPLHSNVAFWKANSAQLTNDQGVLLRKLCEIGREALENDDKMTLKVVLNDFGMFVTHYSQGREWVERIPQMLKVAMDALRVEDEELQAQAIQTVSKLLLNKVI